MGYFDLRHIRFICLLHCWKIPYQLIDFRFDDWFSTKKLMILVLKFRSSWAQAVSQCVCDYFHLLSFQRMTLEIFHLFKQNIKKKKKKLLLCVCVEEIRKAQIFCNCTCGIVKRDLINLLSIALGKYSDYFFIIQIRYILHT